MATSANRIHMTLPARPPDDGLLRRCPGARHVPSKSSWQDSCRVDASAHGLLNGQLGRSDWQGSSPKVTPAISSRSKSSRGVVNTQSM